MSVTYEPYGLCLNWLQEDETRGGGLGVDVTGDKGGEKAETKEDAKGTRGKGNVVVNNTQLLPNWAGKCRSNLLALLVQPYKF